MYDSLRPVGAVEDDGRERLMDVIRRLVTGLLLAAAPLVSASARAQDALGGVVVAADGGSAAGVWVVARGAAFADSAAVDGAGRWAIPLPERAWRDAVELEVREPGPLAARYHAASVRLARRDLEGEHGIVLVPRAWTIPTGAYAGTVVEISPLRAFAPVCGGCSAFLKRTDGAGGGVRTWPETRFPLRVVFDRELSPVPITARDSISFWRAVDELERDFGADLLRPAHFAESLSVGDSTPSDLIFVQIDPTLRVAGLGVAGAYGDDIVYGEVRVRTSGLLSGPGGAGIVAHELMHALGLGHTCSWRSLMATEARCPGKRSPRPTPEDVAYAQLVQRVNALQRAHGARWGMEAALAGEEAGIAAYAAAEPAR